MPQLSLYIDDVTLEKVTQTARAENVSVSKLVTGILARQLEDTWPSGFAELCGSIDDPSFVAPGEVDAKDVLREPL